MKIRSLLTLLLSSIFCFNFNAHAKEVNLNAISYGSYADWAAVIVSALAFVFVGFTFRETRKTYNLQKGIAQTQNRAYLTPLEPDVKRLYDDEQSKFTGLLLIHGFKNTGVSPALKVRANCALYNSKDEYNSVPKLICSQQVGTVVGPGGNEILSFTIQLEGLKANTPLVIEIISEFEDIYKNIYAVRGVYELCFFEDGDSSYWQLGNLNPVYRLLPLQDFEYLTIKGNSI